MGRYLVTGAAGFIGAEVAKKIIERGDSVVTIDNLSTGIRGHIPDGVETIIGNTHDPAIIRLLDNEKFNAIYHIAGQSGG